MYELFKSDFAALGGFFGSLSGDQFQPANLLVVIDFETNSKFLVVYAPVNSKPLLDFLPKNFRPAMEKISTGRMSVKNPSDSDMMHSTDAVFTGRVFIYHEDHLSIAELAELGSRFAAEGATAVFRGADYARTQNAMTAPA